MSVQEDSLVGSDATFQYDCNGAEVPLNYMEDLWEFMEKSCQKIPGGKISCDEKFSLTIKNVNLLEGIGGEPGDTLEVTCVDFIKITKDNEHLYEEFLVGCFEPTSSFWTTKQGAYMAFEDQFGRDIPMSVANAGIPFILKHKKSGYEFNTMGYKPEIETKEPDKKMYV